MALSPVLTAPAVVFILPPLLLELPTFLRLRSVLAILLPAGVAAAARSTSVLGFGL